MNEHDEYYPLEPREGDTMTDDEGKWFFEDGEWWLE
jgi:hypothetical protein